MSDLVAAIEALVQRRDRHREEAEHHAAKATELETIVTTLRQLDRPVGGGTGTAKKPNSEPTKRVPKPKAGPAVAKKPAAKAVPAETTQTGPRPGTATARLIEALEAAGGREMDSEELAKAAEIPATNVSGSLKVWLGRLVERGAARGSYRAIKSQAGSQKPATGAAAHNRLGKPAPAPVSTLIGNELPELGQVTAPSGNPHRVGRDKSDYRCIVCGKTRQLRGDFARFNCVA